MVVVDDAQKRSDFGTPLHLFLTHFSGHFTRIFVDACNHTVAIGSFLRSTVVVLDDHRLSTGIFTLQNNYYFARFQANVYTSYLCT